MSNWEIPEFVSLTRKMGMNYEDDSINLEHLVWAFNLGRLSTKLDLMELFK